MLFTVVWRNPHDSNLFWADQMVNDKKCSLSHKLHLFWMEKDQLQITRKIKVDTKNRL